jgi:hypothetical protein
MDDCASERDVAAGKRQSRQPPVELARVDLDVAQECSGDSPSVQKRRPEADEREVEKATDRMYRRSHE